MTTLFISDLHLDEARPRVVELFEHFCADQARAADALYILGDLFEAYIGDDDDAPLNARVAASLRGVAAVGVPVHFLAGNRDFLVGDGFARRAGLDLLADGTVVDLYGTRTVLLHGDVLCTDDAAYQAFRAQVREPAWRSAFLHRPLGERRAFADQTRAASRARTARTDADIMDVNPRAVAATFQRANVTHMIHGHTHRPAIHELTLDGRTVRRAVLGDWYEQGSTLVVDPDQLELRSVPPARGRTEATR